MTTTPTAAAPDRVAGIGIARRVATSTSVGGRSLLVPTSTEVGPLGRDSKSTAVTTAALLDTSYVFLAPVLKEQMAGERAMHRMNLGLQRWFLKKSQPLTKQQQTAVVARLSSVSNMRQQSLRLSVSRTSERLTGARHPAVSGHRSAVVVPATTASTATSMPPQPSRVPLVAAVGPSSHPTSDSPPGAAAPTTIVGFPSRTLASVRPLLDQAVTNPASSALVVGPRGKQSPLSSTSQNAVKVPSHEKSVDLLTSRRYRWMLPQRQPQRPADHNNNMVRIVPSTMAADGDQHRFPSGPSAAMLSPLDQTMSFTTPPLWTPHTRTPPSATPTRIVTAVGHACRMSVAQAIHAMHAFCVVAFDHYDFHVPKAFLKASSSSSSVVVVSSKSQQQALPHSFTSSSHNAAGSSNGGDIVEQSSFRAGRSQQLASFATGSSGQGSSSSPLSDHITPEESLTLAAARRAAGATGDSGDPAPPAVAITTVDRREAPPSSASASPPASRALPPSVPGTSTAQLSAAASPKHHHKLSPFHNAQRTALASALLRSSFDERGGGGHSGGASPHDALAGSRLGASLAFPEGASPGDSLDVGHASFDASSMSSGGGGAAGGHVMFGQASRHGGHVAPASTALISSSLPYQPAAAAVRDNFHFSRTVTSYKHTHLTRFLLLMYEFTMDESLVFRLGAVCRRWYFATRHPIILNEMLSLRVKWAEKLVHVVEAAIDIAQYSCGLRGYREVVAASKPPVRAQTGDGPSTTPPKPERDATVLASLAKWLPVGSLHSAARCLQIRSLDDLDSKLCDFLLEPLFTFRVAAAKRGTLDAARVARAATSASATAMCSRWQSSQTASTNAGQTTTTARGGVGARTRGYNKQTAELVSNHPHLTSSSSHPRSKPVSEAASSQSSPSVTVLLRNARNQATDATPAQLLAIGPLALIATYFTVAHDYLSFCSRVDIALNMRPPASRGVDDGSAAA